MAKSWKFMSTMLLLMIMFVSLLFSDSQHYFFVSLLFILLAMLPFVYAFHRNKMRSREIVMIAILGALAAISRVPFAPLPSVQPSTFIIMVSAMVLGSQNGFVIGSLTALLSNIFLGHGPWTPWQMFAWGMIGFITGLLRHTPLIKNKHLRAFCGFIFGVLFGWFMNLWVILSLNLTFSWEIILLYYGSSVAFDLAHGLSNIVFLYLFGDSFIEVLSRFKLKYGLFQKVE